MLISSLFIIITCDNAHLPDDLLVVSNEAVWGYKIVVETDRSGGFVIVVVTLVLGVAISALINKANPSAKRSTD